MSGPLIVTAELAPPDRLWLTALRRRYFPPERNHLDAHLTMFHSLPPSAEVEIRRRVAEEARGSPPKARLEGLMNLGSGVAFRVVSDDLKAIRESLSDGLSGLLSAQDRAGWRPHITVQNKVQAKEARALLEHLEREFRPLPLAIAGLGLYRYAGGPWEDVAVYPFRGR